MKVFLIGMPGSGKSTLGKQLSKKLNKLFIDLDEEIVNAAGMSIADIFDQSGEPYFRELEHRLLKESINQHPDFVMATGGGTPCFFDNLKIMKATGRVAFMNTDLQTIKKRLIDSEIEKRPLLKGLSLQSFEEEFNQKFRKRLEIYQQAHLIINEKQTIHEIISQLL